MQTPRQPCRRHRLRRDLRHASRRQCPNMTGLGQDVTVLVVTGVGGDASTRGVARICFIQSRRCAKFSK